VLNQLRSRILLRTLMKYPFRLFLLLGGQAVDFPRLAGVLLMLQMKEWLTHLDTFQYFLIVTQIHYNLT
jgi:hypothetical protein